MSMSRIVGAGLGALIMVLAKPSLGADEWKPPEIKLPEPITHPRVAALPEELERLRVAWKADDANHKALIWIVDEADKGLKAPLNFPPRGAQHNQWYQCDACQRGLVTVDATHHKCPGCGKVYSGEPYDDVIFGRIHRGNLRYARMAAWAYAITGDAKYAAFTAKVLLGYAERYAAYPFHDNASADGKHKPGKSGGHLFEQTLDEAYTTATEIGPAFDLVYPELKDDERKTIREKLIQPMLENIANNKAGKSNWQTWHNAAFVWGGACLDDAAWLKRAVEDPANGFLFQMKDSVTGDGMWFENSWGYHFYTLGAMVCISEGARRLGMDLWNHPSYKKMFTLPVYYTMADGTLPRFGDDVTSSGRGNRVLLEAAQHAYKDPAILALLDATPSFESVMFGRDTSLKADPPKLESRVFKDAGHAILRTQGAAGLTAAFTFGPFGGFHGHFDKLTFVLFGYGRELGVDPGRAKSQAYRLPIHTNWYRATLGHNGVVVDRKSQTGADGELDLFAANERFAAVRARCYTAYKDFHQTRLLVLAPEYLLVFDELSAPNKAERRYDWLYHERSKAATCDAAAEAGELKDYPGVEFIKNVKTGATDKPVKVLFEDEAGATQLLLDAQPGTQVTTGDGPLGSVDERVPLAMVTRKSATARFAAVIEPCAKDGKPTVEAVTIEEKDGVVTLTVARGPERDTVTLSGKTLEVKRGAEKVLEGQEEK
ncbi:MAG: alginate lyase family protein [Planctomycetes bacterium]|nr:alginate lyase family protein [Planctomycetota bacterium]